MDIPNKSRLIEKAGKCLGWDGITDSLSSLTISPAGTGLAVSLIPDNLPDIESVRTKLRETSEMKEILSEGKNFPLSGFEDVGPAIGRALKDITLEILELKEIAAIIGISRRIKSFLLSFKDKAPVLYRIAAPIENLPEIKERIDFCITESGEINENATPEMREMSRNVRSIKNKIIKKLGAYISSSEYSQILMDNYYTQREDRYVLPVKAEYKTKIEGIVHDSSSSGATIFLEPAELVELNNQLKMAESELRREIQRILKELTNLVSKESVAIENNLNILSKLDLIHAKARLSHVMNAVEPEINQEGNIALKSARHPLLILGDPSTSLRAGDSVIPNDITISPDCNVLVISGPNTGGKTVTLKTVGLMGLMVRAGLHIPADKDSAMAVFPEIYADIGDEQDIGRHLSTFSGHLMNIIGILISASPKSLVLMDELMISTDPSEGGALAEAVLIELSKRGVKVIATTHYGQLKAAGMGREGFRNASVEFDLKTLSPTYRLIQGIPGGSSALDIAARLGMDKKIIELSLSLMKERDKRLDDAVVRLEGIKKVLEEETQRQSSARKESETLMEDQRRITERMKEDEREYLKSKKKRLSKDIAEARDTIKKILDELKAEKTTAKLKLAEEKIEKAAKDISASSSGDACIPLEQMKSGDRVEVASLGVYGILLETPSDKKKVRVLIGNMETIVDADMVKGKEKVIQEAGGKRKEKKLAAYGLQVETECDLRGMRVDEARERAIKFLDRAYQSDLPEIRIIHGYGTEAVKNMLREYLKDSPYITGFRPGNEKEGGDGVTIVELK
ncbi:MAG: endonuclease MutS2 [Nitrospinae bacterium]|nr:endonuclease MutS2 [Nitrospinota bacterium]